MDRRKRVAIVQSNYIPWKGYFDLINSVDEFILLDDVQYTRRDWRNRNRIKTAGGVIWLTIPVNVKGRYDQRIDETTVSDPNWADAHWTTIRHNYAGARHFEEYAEAVQGAYRDIPSGLLSEVNSHMLTAICGLLGIRTPITHSTDYHAAGRKGDRLLNLCLEAGANEYLSGPTARSYLDETSFAQAGVATSFFSYDGYPEYEQLHPPFEHAVSILDLIFNAGHEAASYMKSFSAAVGHAD